MIDTEDVDVTDNDADQSEDVDLTDEEDDDDHVDSNEDDDDHHVDSNEDVTEEYGEPPSPECMYFTLDVRWDGKKVACMSPPCNPGSYVVF